VGWGVLALFILSFEVVGIRANALQIVWIYLKITFSKTKQKIVLLMTTITKKF
jgi:hypothetical protein